VFEGGLSDKDRGRWDFTRVEKGGFLWGEDIISSVRMFYIYELVIWLLKIPCII
jgi:hypothetical protein